MRLTIYRLIALGFAGLVVSLVLTPLIRELNRRLGMIDKPDPRRINKVPIPRGGGIAIFLSLIAVFMTFTAIHPDVFTPARLALFNKMVVLSTGIVALGYADDKFSLPPKVKLLGQLVVAFLSWFWAGLGFSGVIPHLPEWLDGVLTVFWITGAINAFNLIDGLDGLASGLALIATIGMGGALVFTGHVGLIYFHVVLAGVLLGFLRYNYNPASVFLGDSGSMFLGFTLAALPLVFDTADSLFAAVGVPMLAMGVPIFDTSLAILRRSIRHLLAKRGDAAGNDKVMTADTDHLHHRILRASGLNQRKAAWVLYLIASGLVLFALANVAMESRRAGLWLAGLTLASIVVFRNFARIELYDATRLLSEMAHDRDFRKRRKYQRLGIPIYMACDLAVIVATFFAAAMLVQKPLALIDLMLTLPIYAISFFAALVAFRAYRTVWSRAVVSNYLRLFLAVFFGAVIATLGIYYAPGISIYKLRASFVLFVLLPFLGFTFVRLIRPILRDLFYALDCRRLIQRKDVSRVLVYGAGLRYVAFRKELVRTASENKRIIVGLLDDDILLRGHFIGGIQVKGTINDAPDVINELNIDAVVISCQMSDSWKKIVTDVLRPTGVKVTYFQLSEEEIP